MGLHGGYGGQGLTTEPAILDVAMIARNGIDRIIELESENANLRSEVGRLRELSDEMFSAMTAALLLAPHSSGAYEVLDTAIKSLQPKWIRRAEEEL